MPKEKPEPQRGRTTVAALMPDMRLVTWETGSRRGLGARAMLAQIGLAASHLPSPDGRRCTMHAEAARDVSAPWQEPHGRATAPRASWRRARWARRLAESLSRCLAGLPRRKRVVGARRAHFASRRREGDAWPRRRRFQTLAYHYRMVADLPHWTKGPLMPSRSCRRAGLVVRYSSAEHVISVPPPYSVLAMPSTE